MHFLPNQVDLRPLRLASFLASPGRIQQSHRNVRVLGSVIAMGRVGAYGLVFSLGGPGLVFSLARSNPTASPERERRCLWPRF
jgi:hypothetical protein